MHGERLNQNRPAPEFKVGDAVKYHVQVKPKPDTGEFEKLAYKSRGPLNIITVLGNNFYEVHH